MLVFHLGVLGAVGIDAATYQQLKQLSEALLAAEAVPPAMAGLDALAAGSILGPELQQWAQQLQPCHLLLPATTLAAASWAD
jgi:hypothetical protein